MCGENYDFLHLPKWAYKKITRLLLWVISSCPTFVSVGNRALPTFSISGENNSTHLSFTHLG